MMFALGFFSGVLFLITVTVIYTYKNQNKRQLDLNFQTQKDELLLKALPVYTQAVKVFKTDEIDPKKLASLMFIAKLVDQNLDNQIENANQFKTQ